MHIELGELGEGRLQRGPSCAIYETHLRCVPGHLSDTKISSRYICICSCCCECYLLLFSSMKQCKRKMAKSPFTFFAAAAAAAKIKENILHHLSLCSLIEREGNLFDLWLCFPSLPFSLSLFLPCPYSCCRCCCCFDLL